MFTLASGEPVPAVTTGQMREVDRSMTEDFGIDLPRMMENAGRNLAGLAQLLFAPRSAIVLSGLGRGQPAAAETGERRLLRPSTPPPERSFQTQVGPRRITGGIEWSSAPDGRRVCVAEADTSNPAQHPRRSLPGWPGLPAPAV